MELWRLLSKEKVEKWDQGGVLFWLPHWGRTIGSIMASTEPATPIAAAFFEQPGITGFSSTNMSNLSEPWCDTTFSNCTNDSLIITASENETASGQQRYMSSLGVWLAMPEWEAALTATVLSLIIVLTLVGNALVIMSVFTYRPLRSAPNFFIVSLAVADMTVAILVLPLNVAYSILGRWVLGKLICEFWVTSDVLCCTGEEHPLTCVLNAIIILARRFALVRQPQENN